MGEALQRAIEALAIRDVLVRTSSAQVADGFDPTLEGVDGLTVQLKHLVTQAVVLEVTAAEDRVSLFRVSIELGARWVKSRGQETSAETSADTSEGDAVDVKAAIEATMVAEYEVTRDLDKDALDAFALQNAIYHVWPYWREFLASQCSLMNLPKLMLPVKQFASNRDDPPVTE